MSTAATTISAESIEVLLTLIAHGDPGAFDRLYHRVRNQVTNTARRSLRDVELAHEVTQEVFLHIWQHAGRYDPTRGSAMGWIHGLTRSKAIDRVRAVHAAQQRDHLWVAGSTRLHPPASEPQQAAQAQQESAHLHAALTGITIVQRQAIVLAFFAGQTHPQIAERLSCPLGTVKTRIRDGLLQLRRQLGDDNR